MEDEIRGQCLADFHMLEEVLYEDEAGIQNSVNFFEKRNLPTPGNTSEPS
jgi:hypothetical protein